MPHAAFPQGAQHGRIGVALHRVQHLAGEGGAERARGLGQHRGTQAMHRIFRTQVRDQVADTRQQRDGAGAIIGAAAERRNGGTNAQHFHGKYPRNRTRTRDGARKPRGKSEFRRRALTRRRRTQSWLRGLRAARLRRAGRSAVVRSANIGVFPNDPGPRMAGPDEKNALRRCCAPGSMGGGSRHVRLRQEPHDPSGSGGRALIGELCSAVQCVFRGCVRPLLHGSFQPAAALAPTRARYSQTTVAAARAVISAVS